MREALRQYIENRYATYTPTKAEVAAIKKGRAAFKRGEYVTLDQLHHEPESARQQKRTKGSRKSS